MVELGLSVSREYVVSHIVRPNRDTPRTPGVLAEDWAVGAGTASCCFLRRLIRELVKEWAVGLDGGRCFSLRQCCCAGS